MNFFKSYTFRIYPSRNDLKIIKQCFAANRFVYNYILNLMIHNHKSRIKKSLYYYLQYLDTILYENPWLQICSKEILKINIFEIYTVFENNVYKCERNYENIKYPKFKSRYNSLNSFRINCKDNDYVHIDLKKQKLYIRDFPLLTIRGYKKKVNFVSPIISVTFLCRFDKKYYAVISVKESKKANHNNIDFSKMVGIDIGVKHLLVTSDGEFFENMHFGLKSERKLHLLKKQLSSKSKGSNNYIKIRKKLDYEYFKLRQQRKHYIYKVVNEIVDKYDIIFLEDLNVGSMLNNSNLSTMIRDASFYKIMQIFERKCLEKNKVLFKIDRFYPSSQLCSKCGMLHPEYRNISKRVFECEFCGTVLDRDYNASLNILTYGKKKFMNTF